MDHRAFAPCAALERAAHRLEEGSLAQLARDLDEVPVELRRVVTEDHPRAGHERSG